MGVGDCFGLRPAAIDGEMQKRLFRLFVARKVASVCVEPGDARGVKKTEAGVGRRYEKAAVLKARAQIAGAAVGEAARVKELANTRHFFSSCCLAHCIMRMRPLNSPLSRYRPFQLSRSRYNGTF